MNPDVSSKPVSVANYSNLKPLIQESLVHEGQLTSEQVVGMVQQGMLRELNQHSNLVTDALGDGIRALKRAASLLEEHVVLLSDASNQINLRNQSPEGLLASSKSLSRMAQQVEGWVSELSDARSNGGELSEALIRDLSFYTGNLASSLDTVVNLELQLLRVDESYDTTRAVAELKHLDSLRWFVKETLIPLSQTAHSKHCGFSSAVWGSGMAPAV